MAKNHSFLDLPHPGLTTVHSKAYGTHTRAARGTKSKVEVNDTLKRHNLLLTNANIPARLVKNAIDTYRSGFPSGQLWQLLVSMFKMQLKMKIPLNVDRLMLKDINKEYTLSTLVKQGFKKEITVGLRTINIDIEKLNPQFRRKAIDGYLIEVVVVFFDFDRMETTSDSSTSPILPLSHDQVMIFKLKTGRPGDHYLICLKLTGCVGQEVQSDNSVRCMQIIQTGMIV
jgi:hypothetical protein